MFGLFKKKAKSVTHPPQKIVKPNCTHCKGGGLRTGFSNDYNLWHYTFADGRSSIKCLLNCGYEVWSDGPQKAWEEAVKMFTDSSNSQNSTERMLPITDPFEESPFGKTASNLLPGETYQEGVNRLAKEEAVQKTVERAEREKYAKERGLKSLEQEAAKFYALERIHKKKVSPAKVKKVIKKARSKKKK